MKKTLIIFGLTVRKQRPLAVALTLTCFGFSGGTPANAGGSHWMSNVETRASVMSWLNPSQETLSTKKLEEKRIAARRLNTRHGNGSYICAASGFGQRSKCVVR